MILAVKNLGNSHHMSVVGALILTVTFLSELVTTKTQFYGMDVDFSQMTTF